MTLLSFLPHASFWDYCDAIKEILDVHTKALGQLVVCQVPYHF